MDHLIKDSATLELYAWLAPDADLPGWDAFTSNPFGTSLPEDQFTTVQIQARHPHRVYGKYLVRARSKGDYTVSFHDSSWLDYLRLLHSLNLSTLDEVSNHYWTGKARWSKKSVSVS